MNRKSHIKADMLFLGYTLPFIHDYIDSIMALKIHGPRHRIFHHNERTLEYLEESFGKKAYYVALLHILIDLDIVMDRKELEKYLKEMI